MEIWRDVTGFEGYYQVSNTGKIRSLNYRKKKGVIKELSPRINKNGYAQVMLSLEGQYYMKYVHRLVAKEFVPNPHSYPIINHKDENKSNNNADNLEWCTIKYNNSYGSRPKNLSISHKGKKASEETRRRLSEVNKGENNPMYGKHPSEETRKKISEANLGKTGYFKGKYGNEHHSSKAVVQLDRNTGLLVASFESGLDAYRKCGYYANNINRCCNGKLKTYKGYCWMFKSLFDEILKDMEEK